MKAVAANQRIDKMQLEISVPLRLKLEGSPVLGRCTTRMPTKNNKVAIA